MAAVHVYNRQPARRLKWDTPITAWSGKIPDIKYFHVFGCKAYVYVHKDTRINKLQPKAKVMIFVSYELGTKGYKFWDPKSQSIVVSCDATFDEMSFPRRLDSNRPPIQPEQPTPANLPENFSPDNIVPPGLRPDSPASRPNEPQPAEDRSDDDDLYTD